MRRVFEVYPGCPSFSWMVANRVTNRHEESDAFITFTGRKGSGKSTSSIAFCEGLAEDIAMIRGKSEDPHQFFNIDHIRTISKMGAIELLTSGVLRKKNSIILLDDAGTQWSNRNFATMINKYLNQIVQIMRVYQGVLVANFIMKKHIDIQAREMVDYRAKMLWKDTQKGKAYFLVFYIEQGDFGEYVKYLTWHGKRITTFEIERPVWDTYKQYKQMRQDNTDTFIEEAQKEVQQKYRTLDSFEKKPDGRFKDPLKEPIILENKDLVLSLAKDPRFQHHNGEPNENKIAKEAGITRHWAGRIISLDKRGKFNNQEPEDGDEE